MAEAPQLPEAGGPLFSVLIPAFYAACWLEQCVISVLDQAHGDTEILICDDCSGDETLTVARVLAARFPQVIRVLENPANRGPSFSRNRLIDAARGDYVWFLDADDHLLPGAVMAVKSAIERHQPDIVGGDYRKGRWYKRAFAGPRNRLLTDRDVIVAGVCGSRKMYVWLRISRRSLWQSGLRFPEGRLFEDAAVTPFLLLRATSYVHLSRALVQYRVTATSIMGRINRGRQKFRHEANSDLAHALDGIDGALSAAGIPVDGQARFAVSHFIAMEYRKVVRRIRQAGTAGTGRADVAGLAAEFRAVMDSASPIGFAELISQYLRRGRLVAWFQLRDAVAAATP